MRHGSRSPAIVVAALRPSLQKVAVWDLLVQDPINYPVNPQHRANRSAMSFKPELRRTSRKCPWP
jgi:hypothetical protein